MAGRAGHGGAACRHPQAAPRPGAGGAGAAALGGGDRSRHGPPAPLPAHQRDHLSKPLFLAGRSLPGRAGLRLPPGPAVRLFGHPLLPADGPPPGDALSLRRHSIFHRGLWAARRPGPLPDLPVRRVQRAGRKAGKGDVIPDGVFDGAALGRPGPGAGVPAPAPDGHGRADGHGGAQRRHDQGPGLLHRRGRRPGADRRHHLPPVADRPGAGLPRPLSRPGGGAAGAGGTDLLPRTHDGRRYRRKRGGRGPGRPDAVRRPAGGRVPPSGRGGRAS